MSVSSTDFNPTPPTFFGYFDDACVAVPGSTNGLALDMGANELYFCESRSGIRELRARRRRNLARTQAQVHDSRRRIRQSPTACSCTTARFT